LNTIEDLPPSKLLKEHFKEHFKETIETNGPEEVPEKPKKKEKKDKKDKNKKKKKKTGYNIYFEEKIKEFKDTHEGESRNYLEFNMTDSSRKYGKEWKEMDEEIKNQYNNRAEEFNIISENIERHSLPSKESSDMSDTESDGPKKKLKTS